MIDTPTLRKDLAQRDTRCRHCWARIRRGESVMHDGSIFFHVECEPRFTGFPTINRLTDEGELPDEIGHEHDDYYTDARMGNLRRGVSPS